MGEGGAYASTPFLKEPCTFALLSAALRRPGATSFMWRTRRCWRSWSGFLAGRDRHVPIWRKPNSRSWPPGGESLIQGAGDGDSQTEEFRSLFLDTWQTQRETVTAWGVTPKAVALFVGLAQEYRRADYDRGYDFYE